MQPVTFPCVATPIHRICELRQLTSIWMKGLLAWSFFI
jgi:hypothetical protein